MSEVIAKEGEQQHPIAIYFWVWGLLFVLSALSYMVDYMQLQGYLRWSLILFFMFLKAGFIIAVFMHMFYERLAMACAILIPMGCLLVLIGLMSFEANYTKDTRAVYLDGGTGVMQMEGSAKHD
ncbi:MAG: cytochrome C oxidase subunit IV family protein [Cycloclasticus sp.]|nr:cytochrome C oxidase subunit IV family protein [Cycloclasticus sp.]